MEHFTPQISILSNQAIAQVKADLRFTELLEKQVDYASLLASAQVLARLAKSGGFSKPLQPGQYHCRFLLFLQA